MPDRVTGELTAQESKACAYHVGGMSKAEAVKQAFERSPVDHKRLQEKASRLFAVPHMLARMRELIDASKVQDLCSVGRWGEMVLEGIKAAKTDKNWTAYFNGTRQLGQAVGALQGDVNLTMEARASDKALAEQLAGTDKAKLKAVREMLGAEDTFDQSIDKAGVERVRRYEQARKASETTKSQGQDKASQAEQWVEGTSEAYTKAHETFKAGTGGKVIQPCDVPETPSRGHAALSIVPEAKDTFDA